LEDSSEEEGVLVLDDPNIPPSDEESDCELRARQRREEQERLTREEERSITKMEEQVKKKRKKSATPQVKKYTDVPKDESGKPIMPILLRGLTIHNLGHVVTKKKFHAKRYIWPVQFKSSRIYSSMAQLEARCEYISEIIETSDEPRFIVTCLEEATNPIVIEASTASGAWAEVGKRVNDLKEELTGKRMYTQLSGPEMFGFSHPTIAKLIQELPGAEKCDKYQRQVFEESTGPSTVLPANSRKKRRIERKLKKKPISESDSEANQNEIGLDDDFGFEDNLDDDLIDDDDDDDDDYYSNLDSHRKKRDFSQVSKASEEPVHKEAKKYRGLRSEEPEKETPRPNIDLTSMSMSLSMSMSNSPKMDSFVPKPVPISGILWTGPESLEQTKKQSSLNSLLTNNQE